MPRYLEFLRLYLWIAWIQRRARRAARRIMSCCQPFRPYVACLPAARLRALWLPRCLRQRVVYRTLPYLEGARGCAAHKTAQRATCRRLVTTCCLFALPWPERHNVPPRCHHRNGAVLYTITARSRCFAYVRGVRSGAPRWDRGGILYRRAVNKPYARNAAPSPAPRHPPYACNALPARAASFLLRGILT